MGTDHVAVVRRICEIWRQGAEARDPTTVEVPYREGLIDPDATFSPIAEIPGVDGRTFVGVEGMREFLFTWIENWEDWRFFVEEIHEVDPDRVVAQIRQTAIGRGSGAPVDIRSWMLMTFRDGRVVERRDYADLPAAMVAARTLSA